MTVTRARLIVAAFATAMLIAVVTAASAASTTTPRCVAPRLVGLTERAAAHRARAAGCVVHLTGARLKRATVQTIAAQAPSPGARSVVVRLTLNPLCFGSALAGPPHDEGMRPGPTELITGLYLVGGPALPYSTRGCRYKSGRPTTGDRAGAMTGRTSSRGYPRVGGGPSRAAARLVHSGLRDPCRPEARTGTGSSR